jgi:long-subunit acyl-CoA synthetase (AMP-forming)
MHAIRQAFYVIKVENCLTLMIYKIGEHKISVGDVMISFLPLAHMLERACENAMFYSGGKRLFYTVGDKGLLIYSVHGTR